MMTGQESKHVAAVEQLEKDLLAKASDLMDDDANWVRIYRSKVEAPKSDILQVPFIHRQIIIGTLKEPVIHQPVLCVLSI
jgi:hypothetical protein